MNELRTWLRWGVIIGVFGILICTPLIVANSMFFPFITGKNFFFRAVVEIIFAAWIILAYIDPAYRPKKNWITLALLGFVAIIGIADFLGVDSFKSFWSDYERMEGYVTILHLFAYFLVATTVLSTERLWKAFFQTSLGVSMVIAVSGFVELKSFLTAGKGVRLDVFFGNAEYLAGYALIQTFIAALLMVREKASAWWRWLYALAAIINIVILFLTATRGAILGLIGGVLLTTFLLAILEKKQKRIRQVSIGILATVVILVGAFIALRHMPVFEHNSIFARFSTVSSSDITDLIGSLTFSSDCSKIQTDTVRSRCMVWHTAWQGFKERPLLGWGQGNFGYVFSKYYNPGMYDQEPWFDRAHNVLFDWMISGGALGALGYVLLYGLAIYTIWKIRSWGVAEKSIFTGLFIGYFFHNLFVFDNVVSYFLFFSLLAYLAAMRYTDVQTTGNDTSKTENQIVLSSGQRTTFAVLIPVVIVVAGMAMYITVIKPLEQNLVLLQGLIAAQQGAVSQDLNQQTTFLNKGLADFKQALAYNTFGEAETAEHLSQTAVSIYLGSNAPNQIKKDYVNLANDALSSQMTLYPNDLRIKLFYAAFLQNLGEYDTALKVLQNAEQIAPTYQRTLLQMGSIYTAEKKYDKALAAFKQAYDLAPQFADVQQSYAISAIYNGKDSLATQIMGTTTIPANEKFARAYEARGDLQKATAIRERVVQASPNDINALVSLAASYYKEGLKSKAIAEIQRVSAVDPSLKDQADQLVNDIQSGKSIPGF